MSILKAAVAVVLSVQTFFTAAVGETEIDTVKFETAETIRDVLEPEIIEPIEVSEPDYTVLEIQFGEEEYATEVETSEYCSGDCENGSSSSVCGGVSDYDVSAIESEQKDPPMHLWNVCILTFYDDCAACCGRAGANTASGVKPTINHTVACGDLPFGTRLMIEGQEYVVEDRGVTGFWVDIFVATHEEALQRGMYQAEVWIIDG